MKSRQLVWGMVIGCCLASVQPAEARWGVAIGIGFPVPYYPRPWVIAPAPYYYPVPVYYSPVPVYQSPGPIFGQPGPVVVQPTPLAGQPAGGGNRDRTRPSSIDQNLDQLRSPQEATRREAALNLGRTRVDRAIDPLTATLAGDKSPQVRAAAAQALGLIGSSRSLTALIHASTADNDRDVRLSAQFAVEVIRAYLRRE